MSLSLYLLKFGIVRAHPRVFLVLIFPQILLTNLAGLCRELVLSRKTTFRALVDALYGTTYGFRVKGTGPYVDPCERVAVFLFRVGGGRGVRETAGHFDIAEGTVVNWTMSVAKLVMERLEERYVRWPDPDEQRHISKEWEQEKELRWEPRT